MGRIGRIAALTSLAIGAAAHAQDAPAPARPSFAVDGTVHVPAFDLPPSSFLSPEALAVQASRAAHPGGAPSPGADIAAVRSGLEALLAPQVARMRKRYPVDVVEQAIAGVRTRVVTPQGRPADPKRVLINLHGGGFAMCAEACAMLESVPIASLGGFKVVTVDYRMGPEAVHPAALEDLTKVYRELLRSYAPKQIGIYGCSAGGALTGEAGAWLPAHGLPQPGALGIFGAGAIRSGSGDSTTVTAYTDGSFGPAPKPGQAGPDMSRGYFAHADMTDATISAALHPETIAKFPPTILITGTRAIDMSAAIVTNSRLIKASIRSELIVGEGMGHCYIYQSQLPEARDAYDAIVAFFRSTLG